MIAGWKTLSVSVVIESREEVIGTNKLIEGCVKQQRTVVKEHKSI